MDVGARDGVFGGPAARPQDGDDELGAGLGALMDELAHGVLIVSQAGKLLHANQAARHELARRRVAGAGGRLLQLLAPPDAQALQTALHKAIQGKRSLITVSLGQGEALSLAVLPLRSQEEAGSPAMAALMFARTSVCDSLMLCFFARGHGLTNAEEQVLGILCQGYSAPQVAAQLKVAVSTVRSHVRSLCAKTRSRGVRELVKRLAVLPPVAPAPWKEPLH